MRVVYILFLWMISVMTFAQKADSLRILIAKTKADSTKTILMSLLTDELTKTNPSEAYKIARQGITLAKNIGYEKGLFENYFSLAAAFQGQALFDSAIFFYHKAYHSANRMDFVSGQAEVYSGLGHSFMRKFQMDSARHYLDQGLALATSIKDYRVEAGIYNNYGNIYLDESEFQKALDYFIKAAKLYENPINDAYGQCIALSNIGNIEYRLGNFDQAQKYADQSMALARKNNFVSSVGYAHKLLGRIYRKQQKFDEALNEYRQSQAVYLQLGDTRSLAEVSQNIGNILFDKGQHSEALGNYKKALYLAKSVSNKVLVAGDYSCIGMAYMALKKYPEALIYLDSSRIAAQEIGNKYLVMDSYDVASMIYEAQGQYKKALEAHRQFAILKDSIIESENRQLAEETQAKYELEKKEAQIALLEKDKELKNLELERHNAIQIGIMIALILILIIAILLVHRYRIQNRIRRQAEIERVRNTIAKDLHDDIGSTLSTISIISKLAIKESSNGVERHLHQIAEQSSRMMESISDIVWSINPMSDSMEKVVVKMKEFAAEILEPKNITYRFTGDSLLNGVSLDAEKRKNLFLIYKESLNNAAKYSNASEVDVSLTQAEEKFTMNISDNGSGFDRNQIKEGNGLRNMEARAKAMGAKFSLESIKGKGTRVAVELRIT